MRLLRAKAVLSVMGLIFMAAPSMAQQIGSAPQAIVNGTPDVSHEFVLQLWQATDDPDDEDGLEFFCSGVLITEDWLLTAAHCLDQHVDAPWEVVVVLSGDRQDALPEDEQQWRIGAEAHLHPLYDTENHPSVYDLAVIRVDAPIIDRVPATVLDGLLADYVDLNLDEDVELVGFGDTDPRRSGSTGDRMSTDMVVTAMGQSMMVLHPSVDEGYPCDGDSGGAVLAWLDDESDEQVLVGIITGTNLDDGACTDPGIASRIDTEVDWVDWVIADAPTPHDCECARAEVEHGWCADELCDEIQACAQTYNCFHNCRNLWDESDIDDGFNIFECYTVCQAGNDLTSIGPAGRYINCAFVECDGVVFDRACAEQLCWSEAETCLDDDAGETVPSYYRRADTGMDDNGPLDVFEGCSAVPGDNSGSPIWLVTLLLILTARRSR